MTVTRVANHVGIWLAAPIMLSVLGFWFLASLYEREPLIEVVSAPTKTPAAPVLTPPSGSTRKISEVELDAALSAPFLDAEAGNVRSRAVLSRFGVLLAMSAELPRGSGKYINLRATLRPRQDGFDVARLAIGPYEVPSGWADWAFQYAMEHFSGARRTTQILTDIRGIDSVERSVTMGPAARRPTGPAS